MVSQNHEGYHSLQLSPISLANAQCSPSLSGAFKRGMRLTTPPSHAKVNI